MSLLSKRETVSSVRPDCEGALEMVDAWGQVGHGLPWVSKQGEMSPFIRASLSLRWGRS